jgi:chromosome partitioning protein
MAYRRTLAFHSYKGGSGKTTLITNIAALYAKSGLNVGVVDFDLYAPSLVSYFDITPERYLNDLLSGEAELSEVVMDLGPKYNLGGKLLVAFSSPEKDDIDQIDRKNDEKWQFQALKRFIRAKKELFEEHNLDYLFLDTSPGVRYWSINTLTTGDLLFLTLKDSVVDTNGTNKMIHEIYDRYLSRYGSKYYLILNKVPGAPQNAGLYGIPDEQAWVQSIEREVKAKVVGSIPCFCDVQFNRHEFLTSINQPNHLFSVRIAALAETIKTLSQQ